jgi:hypothetical protein
MISIASILLNLFVFTLVQAPQQPVENVSPSVFVGTWVGVQRWAIENKSPSAMRDQPVTLTIEQVNGKLVGKMDPFFGGSDGASFTDAKIVGEELQAAAIVGQPPAPGQRGATGWKGNTKILLNLRRSGNDMTGTADILLGDVKWLKFDYELGRQRSRY